MFAIAITDNNWFNLQKESQFNSFVNFYNPTPWNVRNPRIGDKWYFFLKAPIRKIAGYGELVEYKEMTVSEAWKYYGVRNGCKDISTFKGQIQKHIDNSSRKFGGQAIDIDEYRIGCTILKNCQFWDSEQYLKPEDYDIEMAGSIQKYKIIDYYDPFTISRNEHNFQPLSDVREDYKRSVNQRKGQSRFKGIILKAYNNRCCITGETCPELLDAAHLQEYINEHSNDVQNGILLRVDIHRLYDNGLLYIDQNYIIHVSTLLEQSIYFKYNKEKIEMPENIDDWPSVTALVLKADNFRK